jgi:hypothetical protein
MSMLHIAMRTCLSLALLLGNFGLGWDRETVL